MKRLYFLYTYEEYLTITKENFFISHLDISVSTPVEGISSGVSVISIKIFSNSTIFGIVKGTSRKLCKSLFIVSQISTYSLTLKLMEKVSMRPSVLKVSKNIKKGIKPFKCPGRDLSMKAFPIKFSHILLVKGRFKKTNRKKLEIIKKSTRDLQNKLERLFSAAGKKDRMTNNT